ncbi:hypothetical protein [Pectobacterium odoriferum]|uniref:hypothetical protein n=1 Tax=Pectobacterium odoriferum TaxID=78398 RepID=UPI0005035EA7|nr:hypothetical protein [Pectobacterium odoriferum]KGA31156.1 hypothetical protein KS43_19670 [Pectobacterium odoriferum]
MSNVIFTYNEESALTAGQGGFINESGAYVITITDALLITSSGGANAIEFSGESDDGRKVQYLSVYTTKKDKSVNTFGANMIHAIMGCAGVKQLTQYMKSAGVYVAPEFSGKRVGLVLQKVISNKPDGSPTYKLDIRIPFIADTRQTLQERHDGKNAETIDKMIATLKDKDERKKSSGSNTEYHYGQDDDPSFSPF